MRLVKLELRDSPFWFLSSNTGEPIITLSENNKISDLVNIDALPGGMVKIINQSVSQFEINILDMNGAKIKTLEEASIVSTEYSVNTSDETVDNSDLPDIVSVTILEKEEEELPKEVAPEVIENAKILLERNGNTVKKSLKVLPKTDSSLEFLHICLDLECKGQKRQGLILIIEEMIMEYSK
jgi:hypothetical protein